jgi:pilus assembly protein CpaF
MSDDDLKLSPGGASGSVFRRDADRGREPQLVAGRAGTRLYSLAALQERIESEFIEEYGDDAPALRQADTTTKQVKLVLETVEYVLGVESVHLDSQTKATLVERIHSNMFGYSVLDALLSDPQVTTIAIHGAEHISVRYGHAELVSVGSAFDDHDHLRRVINRLLVDAGVELDEREPIVETGLTIAGRRAAMNLVMPPVSAYVHVDLRLHPTQPLTLDDLLAHEVMLPDTADLLRKIAASHYGFAIVGEAESGKTTLMNALVQLLQGDGLVSVERGGELSLPGGAVRLTPQWKAEGGKTFGEQIEAALRLKPGCLVLDEIRADEPLMILPLLTRDDAPRQIWSVRGVPDAKRLQSGLGMLARRADMSRSEDMVMALYDRLPFVITLCNVQGKLKLFSVAEWQSRADSDYPDYVMLTQYRDGASRPTGAQVARWLD